MVSIERHELLAARWTSYGRIALHAARALAVMGLGTAALGLLLLATHTPSREHLPAPGDVLLIGGLVTSVAMFLDSVISGSRPLSGRELMDLASRVDGVPQAKAYVAARLDSNHALTEKDMYRVHHICFAITQAEEKLHQRQLLMERESREELLPRQGLEQGLESIQRSV